MIIYLIKSTLLLALLLGLYKLLLENEKMHRFNRFFLLFALIFGLTAPLFTFELSPNTKVAGIELSRVQSAVNASAEAVSRTVEPLMSAAPVTPPAPEQTGTEPVSSPAFTLRNILIGVYGLITFILVLRFLSGLWQLRTNIISGERRRIEGATLVLLDQPITPQSFFRFIFLNKQDLETGKIGKEILEHEQTHVRQLHSLDVLLAEVLKVVFWFNPVIYLYKHAIQLNHEFLADEYVVSAVTNVSDYQKTLLGMFSEERPVSVTSNFNYGLVKKRVIMANKNKSPIRINLKISFLAPLVLFLILVVGCEPRLVNDSPETAIESELTIRILGSNQLVVNNVEMSLDEFDDQLSKLSTAPDLVKVRVTGTTTFGEITDVQRILKQHSAINIDYSTTENPGPGEEKK